jgi:hypothetical protein
MRIRIPNTGLTNLDVLAVQEDFPRDLRAAEKSELAPPVLKNIRIYLFKCPYRIQRETHDKILILFITKSTNCII